MKRTITLFAIALLALSANAKIWRVNNTPGINADFSELQVAIDAAITGDTLYVEGSCVNKDDYVYAYKVTNFNKQLVFIGSGYFLKENKTSAANELETIIDFSDNGGYLYFGKNTNGSIFQGVTITGSLQLNGADDLVFDRCRLLTQVWLGGSTTNPSENCIFSRCFFDGVSIGASCGSPCSYNTSISNCILMKNPTLYGGGDISSLNKAIIVNNVIMGTTAGGSTGSISGCSRSLIQNNITASSISADASTISNNYLIDGNFLDVFQGTGSIDSHYILKSTSPAKNIADDGKDCGAFGGSNPYVLSGLPPIPHIYEMVAPVNGTSTTGLPVKIKVKSQN